jgi:enoyl-CoA hydratase/carnithine racemase
MACDIRVAASSARFAITPAKLGISYPQEDIARLVELVGPGQASRLLFSGSTIDGAEAGRIGLVEIVAEDVDTAAAGLIDALLANSPASLVALKRGIGLAAKGVASEPEQERLFEDLFGSDGVAGRLARLRGKA